MTRRLRVHNGVEDDLFEAFSYYADAAPDQIDRLYNLFVDAVTKRIPQAPNAFAPLFKHYRYYVAYRTTDEAIDILAVRHGMENPNAVEAEISGRTFE
ncbi:toxin ParE2 [Mycobacterium tuberculosis TKK_03_0112]|uniref:type II toxin-antitoxin system RelE/ParE family toxin n=1 Tax=Mycobacterium tuberculosis TaxID=1773 RepID=UPI000459525F|nr:type II toxin-antitoxin system RelE/ParE family toxin [Mycobacterium tuberculosis]KAS76739.1 toxin ParE2 [Mycobacterium tuberculosis TKK_03_0112]